MEFDVGVLGVMTPVYFLFLTSGLTIYTVSSWVGEVLLNQIRQNKTSFFGRSGNYGEYKSRAMYIPPAQLSTIDKSSSLAKDSLNDYNLPLIPLRPPVRAKN